MTGTGVRPPGLCPRRRAVRVHGRGRRLCPRPWSCPRPAQGEPIPPPGLPRRARPILHRRVRQSGGFSQLLDKADKRGFAGVRAGLLRVRLGVRRQVFASIAAHQFLHRPCPVFAFGHPEVTTTSTTDVDIVRHNSCRPVSYTFCGPMREDRLKIGAGAARYVGSRLINDQSQKRTVAARATAERKTFGHLS